MWQGTLPFRALALRYGADTVFTEEVIDRRVVNAVRTENPVLGTVDYLEKRGKKGTATPFQTCPALERGRVVYQIGTGNATNALRAAQVIRTAVARCLLAVSSFWFCQPGDGSASCMEATTSRFFSTAGSSRLAISFQTKLPLQSG